MLFTNKLVLIFVLCFIGTTLSSPTDHVAEGRGIGSTIWSWITYPFTWWSSPSTSEIDETTPSVFTHGNNIEVAKHNVTVWCNDQTCTTMKCDKVGCTNVTCNIYDTDLSGVCREYTTRPDVPASTSAATQVTEESKKTTTEESKKTTEEPKKTTEAAAPVEPSPATHLGIEERPLELEAVLSSTLPIDDGEKDEDEAEAD